MKHRILAFICSIAAAFTASAQVPSLINYQGRLTDSNGAPVTGSKNFAISIYDAATGGNLLYQETIGAVTLDANGVYSFQFGSAGSSTSQVTETIATTDDTNLTYSKALSNTQVVNNSISVTDGTNSWSQSVGNPGVGATATANTIVGFVIGATIANGGSGYTSEPAVTITGSGTGATATATVTDGVVTAINIVSAGSGYTGGATITIDAPVIPFKVDYNSGTIAATYSEIQVAQKTIRVTYRYNTNGIADALSAGVEHWIVVSVNGVQQSTRQRVLAVPFARKAEFAANAEGALKSTLDDTGNQLRNINRVYNERFGTTYSTVYSSSNFTNTIIGLVAFDPDIYTGIRTINIPDGAFLLYASSEESGYYSYGEGWIKYTYFDGSTAQKSRSQVAGALIYKNPNPDKKVVKVESYELRISNSQRGNQSNLKVFSPFVSTVTYNVDITAKEIMVSPILNNYPQSMSAKLTYSDGSISDVSLNEWLKTDSSKTITRLTISAYATTGIESQLSGIKISKL
jgi:hypothetical protein